MESNSLWTWDRLVLPATTLDRLKSIASSWRDFDSAPTGSTGSRGLLLSGRPGTGTTRAARTLAVESGCSICGPNFAIELRGPYLGQTPQKIRELFQSAQSKAPCIVLLDAIDYLAPPRDSSRADWSTNEAVAELLAAFDSLRGPKPAGVFLLATTYGLDKVDRALVARLETIELVLPGLAERRELFALALGAYAVALGDASELANSFAAQTEGMNGRDIEYLVQAGAQAYGIAQRAGERPEAAMREAMVREISSAMNFSC